ncbi:MAG: DUF488 domain-containing protein [Candidatus Aminicenantales bacterium]|jgi:uncharacterized protein YeaO (DUF488 family)
MIKIKRAYDEPEAGDGLRVLVDRLWPRGLTKDKAKIDLWTKEVSPTTGLRKWFGHEPDKWGEFKRRYFRELKGRKEIADLLAEAKRGTVTLVYGAKETKYNNAVALKEYLEKSA